MENNIKELLDLIQAKRPIYKLFTDRSPVLEGLAIRKTKWRGKDSNASLQYDSEQMLETLFCEDNDKTLFDKHYKEATHDGKGLEKIRILTMHSSSLLCLATFYNVTKSNAITFNDEKLATIPFTKVKFEFSNYIPSSESNSQIDICLKDESESNVLFLESKFSEYLTCGKVTDISNKYKDDFEPFQQILESLELELNSLEDSLCLQSKKGRTNVYCAGLKQMICHYLGAVEYATKNPSQEVYLGTILYKFPYEIDTKSKFTSYKKLYQEWAKGAELLNKKPSNLHIIQEPIVYNTLFDDRNHRFSQGVLRLYK